MAVAARVLAVSALITIAPATSSRANAVRLQFEGGAGTGRPLTFAFPQAVLFTVTNDTPTLGVVFVFQGTGNFIGATVSIGSTVSYTTNGSATQSVSGATNATFGVVTSNDLSIFKPNGSPGVAAGDIVRLSNGRMFLPSNFQAVPPPSGLYPAIMVDGNGVQLGVGAPTGGLLADFDQDNDVDGQDFLMLQRGETPPGIASDEPLIDWRLCFGLVLPSAVAVPEPSTGVLVLGLLAATVSARRLGAASAPSQCVTRRCQR
jgi:hypothetical protein